VYQASKFASVRETPSLATRSDSGHTVNERETYQADASRRFISGRLNVQPVAGAEKPLSQDSKMSQAFSQKKSEPISLAAFMGGRATGPRLNKHAPQQDAADPTQFEQRTHIAAPHPVFGRGGIAMPGLVGQRPSAGRFQGGSSADKIFVTTHSQAPPVTKRYDGKAVERAVVSMEAGGSASQRTNATQTVITRSSRIGEDSAISHKADAQELVFPRAPGGKERSVPYQNPSTRERAISTPAGAYSRKDTDRPSSRSSERKSSQFHGVGVDTPNTNRNTSSSPSPSLVSSVNTRHSPPTSYAVKPVQKFPAGTAFLARPIQPEPRLVPQTNPSSILPSPAFMKSSTPKEVTPSISRLQGRGFVQNMVKISSQLESPAPVSPTSKSRAPRKSSVLDRWQPVMASNSTPSPPGSPKSVSTHSSATTNVPRPSPTEPVKKFLRSRASLPSISQGLTEASGAELERNVSLLRKMPPDGAPGLGSATTMAIFKPSRSPVETEFTNVDELGVRMGPVSAEDVERTRVPIELSPPSAKPLSHVR
jgi:hypothetical protein